MLEGMRKNVAALGMAGMLSGQPSVEAAPVHEGLTMPRQSIEMSDIKPDKDRIAWEKKNDEIKKHQEEIEKLHAAGEHAQASKVFEIVANDLIATFQNSHDTHGESFLFNVQLALQNLCEVEADYRTDTDWIAVYKKGFDVAPRLYLDAAETYRKEGKHKDALHLLEEGFGKAAFTHVDWKAHFDIGDAYADSLALNGNVLKAEAVLEKLYADFHELIEKDKGKPIDRIYAYHIVDKDGDDVRLEPLNTRKDFEAYLKFKLNSVWK